MGSSKGRLLFLVALAAVAAVAIFGSGIGSEILSGVNQQTVQLLAQAIADAEGFGPSGNLPTRANNPGDITDKGYPGDTGQTLGSAGVVVFDTVEHGWQALYAKITRWLNGGSSEYPLSDSLATVGLKYSGGDPNWSANVAASLGVDPSVTLGEIAGVQS